MDVPVEIACGHLNGSADEPQQGFTLWRVAEDRVELSRADRQAIGIGPTVIGGHEIAEAIEQVTGRTVTFDYARSRLAWSGGLRPLEPMKALRTKRRCYRR